MLTMNLSSDVQQLLEKSKQTVMQKYALAIKYGFKQQGLKWKIKLYVHLENLSVSKAAWVSLEAHAFIKSMKAKPIHPFPCYSFKVSTCQRSTASGHRFIATNG